MNPCKRSHMESSRRRKKIIKKKCKIVLHIFMRDCEYANACFIKIKINQQVRQRKKKTKRFCIQSAAERSVSLCRFVSSPFFGFGFGFAYSFISFNVFSFFLFSPSRKCACAAGAESPSVRQWLGFSFCGHYDVTHPHIFDECAKHL